MDDVQPRCVLREIAEEKADERVDAENMINMIRHIMAHKKKDQFVHGRTTVGERGQIVIPQAVREALRIEPGDDMIVMARCGKIVVLPATVLESYLETIADQLSVLKKEKRV